jgi:hypothetical protein
MSNCKQALDQVMVAFHTAVISARAHVGSLPLWGILRTSTSTIFLIIVHSPISLARMSASWQLITPSISSPSSGLLSTTRTSFTPDL